VIFGVPGLSTLLYVLSVLAMPVTELARTVTGRSSWQRWRVILRHAALVAVIMACVWLVSENLPAIGALQRGGVLYDVYQWATKASGALMVLLVLVPWLVRAVHRAYHRLGWACAHNRLPHPAKPHPSVLATRCPDCGGLMFHAQEKLCMPKVSDMVEQA
jgi:hypothetical protein